MKYIGSIDDQTHVTKVREILYVDEASIHLISDNFIMLGYQVGVPQLLKGIACAVFTDMILHGLHISYGLCSVDIKVNSHVTVSSEEKTFHGSKQMFSLSFKYFQWILIFDLNI